MHRTMSRPSLRWSLPASSVPHSLGLLAWLGLLACLGSVGACDGATDGPGGPHEDADGSAVADSDALGADTGDAASAAGDTGVDDSGDTGGLGPAEDAELPELSLWAPRAAFEPAGAWAAGHPAAFERVSRWTTQVEGPIDQRPDVGHRGGYGTGNGHAFALIGLTNPLNTLHGLTTPTYERGPRFFGDYAIRLGPADPPTPDPDVADFASEEAAWSLSAPLILTRGRLPSGVVLDTADFAPAAASPGAPGRTCIVRALSIRNEGDATVGGLHVHVTATNPVVAGPGVATMVESIGQAKALTTGFIGDGAAEAAAFDGARTVSLALPSLAPGDEVHPVLLHCGVAGVEPMELPADLDAGVALDALAADYAGWDSRLVAADVPDPMVGDFIDGMKLTLRTQTAASGASCPMSQYTRTWARDNIGPVLAWLALGAHEEVDAMMDYVYGAVLLAGDLKNSYDADLDVSTLPAAPDWASKGTLGTSVAAETPSYMVWIYGDHYLHTGELARAQERWGFLRRALFAQDFSPEGLLPFTGDETFRAAMNAAFGLELESPHHLESFSANSSLLWLGAATHYTRLATDLGEADDLTTTAAQRALVEGAFLGRYLLEDGCISAFIERATDEAWPAPFEDVSLKLGWVDWHPADPAVQTDALACLADRVGVGPGHFQSQVDEIHKDNPFLPGLSSVYTGMLPGYALHALNDVGHPDTEAAFNRVGAALGSSGNLQEYQVGTDDGGLTILYDPGGSLTDYTAKFRPWEGGIVLDAVLDYLVGWEPDTPSGTLRVRPHLPNGWPSHALRGLRAGDDRFDVVVTRTTAGGYTVEVTSHATAKEYTLTVASDGADPVEALLGAGATVSASL